MQLFFGDLKLLLKSHVFLVFLIVLFTLVFGDVFYRAFG